MITFSRHAPTASPLAVAIVSVLAIGASMAACAAPSHPFDGSTLSDAARSGLLAALSMPVRDNATTVAAPASKPASTVAQAATGCGDDANDFTTLRHAVLTANSNDTIDLRGLGCSKITLTNGAITSVVADLTILGPGPGKLTIDGAATDRVFKHLGKGTLTLQGLTVTNGALTADKAYGGCIYDAGNLKLESVALTSCKALGQTGAVGGAALVRGTASIHASVISGNTANAAVGQASLAAIAGGVFAFGSDADNKIESSTISGNLAVTASGLAEAGGFFGYRVSVKYSTLSGNAATSQGNKDNYSGAGALGAGYSLLLQNSTVDNNIADTGGAILIAKAGGFGTVLESTISGNSGNLAIGGISSGAPLSIANSTIAFNAGGVYGGGGVFVAGADLTLQSTIVADNLPADIDGANSVQGAHNLVKIPGQYITLPLDTIALDPQLGPLASNGGPTRTHALGAGSPALDTGSLPLNLPSDQRSASYARTVGNATDIGAFEFDPDHIFGDPFGD